MQDDGAHAGLRTAIRIFLVLLYLVAGFVHLTAPDAFLPIMPGWVPEPRFVILVTGACEVAGALALLSQRWRRAAGVLFAAYAICVFPANLKHAFSHVQVAGIPDSWWYHAPRLALQPVLVWAAVYCAGLISWPLRGRQSG